MAGVAPIGKGAPARKQRRFQGPGSFGHDLAVTDKLHQVRSTPQRLTFSTSFVSSLTVLLFQILESLQGIDRRLTTFEETR